MHKNNLTGKPNTPWINPATYSNSGARAFSGQQAQIFKIIFFNQENNLEYSNYRNNYNTTSVTPTTPVPSTTSNKLPAFLNQEAPPPKVNFYVG